MKPTFSYLPNLIRISLFLLVPFLVFSQESKGKGAPPQLNITSKSVTGNDIIVHYSTNYKGMVEVYLYKVGKEKVLWFNQYVRPDGEHVLKLRKDKIVRRYGEGDYSLEFMYKGKRYPVNLQL